VRQFIVRRLAISALVLLGVSIMLYALARSMPADYVTLSTSTLQKITQEQKDQLRKIYGLDKGLVGGYWDWLLNAARGDLGTSLVFARPVTEIIGKYMPITFTVSAIALFFELLFGIPLGILAARRRNTSVDYAITAFVFIGISMPSFFLAAMLKRALGYYGLNLLPTAGMLNARVIYRSFTFAKALDYIQHLIMPISVFVIINVGIWLRYTRANMIDALSSDYVRTARAKGVPERRVVYSHAFRNTLIPTVTLLGGQLPALFSGAIITENLFGIQGLGNIALTASTMADIPYLMGFNMFLAVCTVLGYLISDILYAVVDPRIRLS
jgi:peptide/nickel transport system permease protein